MLPEVTTVFATTRRCDAFTAHVSTACASLFPQQLAAIATAMFPQAACRTPSRCQLSASSPVLACSTSSCRSCPCKISMPHHEASFTMYVLSTSMHSTGATGAQHPSGRRLSMHSRPTGRHQATSKHSKEACNSLASRLIANGWLEYGLLVSDKQDRHSPAMASIPQGIVRSGTHQPQKAVHSSKVSGRNQRISGLGLQCRTPGGN